MSGNNKPPRIEQWEINKYWEIFSGLNPENGVLTGDKAAVVLKNSQLTDAQLEKIWDLSDVDGDGNLDFEEFCVAMRLIFDLINGVYKDVPQTLPDWLVPADKAHLVAANAAILNKGSGIPRYDANQDDDEDDDELGLSSDFDWYMSRQDKAKYEAIYSADCDGHGDISFDALSGLYASLDIPEVDIRSAWNLINPKQDEKIGRDQAIVFLHILNNRHRGVRVPRSVPASLRATFEHRQIDYNLGNSYSGSEARFTKQATGSDNDTPRNKKSSSGSDFGSSYLERLGLNTTGSGGGGGGGSWAEQEGTDFSSTKDTDWEKVRLKRQLADLQEQVTKAEAASQRRKDEIRNRVKSASSAVVRRELESMYNYKKSLLNKVKNGNGKSSNSTSAALADAKDEIDLVKQQVKALEDYYERRNRDLQLVLDEIQTVKSARA